MPNKEYFIGNISSETISNLKPEGRLSLDQYKTALDRLVLAYHDVYVGFKAGILLVERKEEPAKGALWPLGGRKLKGYSMRDSIREKVRKECKLELGADNDIIYLGEEPPMVYSENSQHTGGLDCLATVYFARKSQGKLILNDEHANPTLVFPIREKAFELEEKVAIADYSNTFRSSLHDYVRDYMDMIFERFILI